MLFLMRIDRGLHWPMFHSQICDSQEKFRVWLWSSAQIKGPAKHQPRLLIKENA